MQSQRSRSPRLSPLCSSSALPPPTPLRLPPSKLPPGRSMDAGRPAWRRGGAESAERPSPNAAGRLCSTGAGAAAPAAAASERRRGKVAALASSSYARSVGQSSERGATEEMSAPYPHSHRLPATQRRRPLAGAGSSGGCGAEKQNATLSGGSEANDENQHSRPLLTLWEPLIRS